MEIRERDQYFEKLKRDFETAYLNGEDYTQLLYVLSKTIVLACINKCSQVGSVSQPEYLSLKRQIKNDCFWSVSEGENTESSPFLDGMDLIQEAACVLLEQAQAHGFEVGWLDKTYSEYVIASRARIKEADTAGYREKTTTPLEECYRTIRRAIEKLQYHKSHGQISLDGLDSSQLDALQKNCAEESLVEQEGRTEKWDSEALMRSLKLTVRQERILTLRMQGYGYQAIATYLGISKSTVTRTLDRLKDKCKALGFAP